ncbi:hypothetical protein CGCS363_v007015 [Colletotrichum siamense]|uniref:uncharacterized protein n=1 Tax=Colletotrichum siamense TaxID=690259 RepID=UPI001872A7A4|nr:uncharacterized protein CGCS363_v007015 [Colletotrichum siamense]KAF5501618.1 hypothetical protein CGCS363_v007015 [Colletotrichum siamense]
MAGSKTCESKVSGISDESPEFKTSGTFRDHDESTHEHHQCLARQERLLAKFLSGCIIFAVVLIFYMVLFVVIAPANEVGNMSKKTTGHRAATETVTATQTSTTTITTGITAILPTKTRTSTVTVTATATPTPSAQPDDTHYPLTSHGTQSDIDWLSNTIFAPIPAEILTPPKRVIDGYFDHNYCGNSLRPFDFTKSKPMNPTELQHQIGAKMLPIREGRYVGDRHFDINIDLRVGAEKAKEHKQKVCGMLRKSGGGFILRKIGGREGYSYEAILDDNAIVEIAKMEEVSAVFHHQVPRDRFRSKE